MAISFVANRGTSIQASVNTAYSFSPNGTLPAGSLAIVLVNSDISVAASASDNAGGNTWAVAKASDTGNRGASILYCVLATQLTSANLITVSFGATNQSEFYASVSQFSGAAASPLDVSAAQAAPAFGTARDAGTTGTLAQADELIVALFAEDTGSITLSGIGAYSTFGIVTDTGRSANGLYQVVSSTTAAHPTATASGNASYDACVVTFKASAAQAGASPTAPRPRAFQEQGAIYSGEKTGFQPLAFQIPDPTRGFQEGFRFGEAQAFQPQAFQKPDPSYAFQPEGFQTETGFQMSVLAFQEPSGFQGDAFQEEALQSVPAAGTTTISAAGAIASAEAFGVPNLVRVEAAVAIASVTAFGTTRAVRLLGPTGIASATAFGNPNLSRILGVAGIATGTAFGTTRVLFALEPQGFEDDDSGYIGLLVWNNDGDFGLSHVLFILEPIGVVSSEAWGKPTESGGTFGNTYTVTGVGAIASAESFGSADRVVRILGPSAVSSTTAFGTTDAVRLLGPAGIGSANTFGMTRAVRVLYPLGITSAEAFGRPTETGGTVGNGQTVSAVGAIASSESFGTTRSVRILGPTGLATATAFGKPSLPRMTQNAGGIASANTFGTTKAMRVIYTLGVSSAQAFGTPTKSPQIVSPQGISSSVAVGVPGYVGPVLFGSVYGAVYLSSDSVYATTTSSLPVYQTHADDARVYAGAVDDTPGS